MRHIGDLTITEDNAHEYAELTSVGGYLSVLAECSLPALTSVIGSLDVQAECLLPALTSVIGSLSVRAECSLPALTSVIGYLYVWAECSLPALTSVGRALYVRAECTLPALTSVGGALYVWAECSLPALTSVGRALYVQAECSLPALTFVGGSLDVQAKVETPYGKLLCVSAYGLFRTAAGTYHAGCRQGLTAEQALAHLGGRTDERAKMFTAAINAAEAANQKDRPMATTTHTEVYDPQTADDFARIEAYAAAAAEVPELRKWYASIIVMERMDGRGWDIIVTHKTREGDEDKTTRVCMSRDEVARVIAQEIEDAE